MLTLPIKKKWFDMILSGEKKEEYREIKPYYISRFRNLLEIPRFAYYGAVISAIEGSGETNIGEILFRNGYSKTSPSFIAECTLSVGTGKEEWGAETGKEYFVLMIHEILERRLLNALICDGTAQPSIGKENKNRVIFRQSRRIDR